MAWLPTFNVPAALPNCAISGPFALNMAQPAAKEDPSRLTLTTRGPSGGLEV